MLCVVEAKSRDHAGLRRGGALAFLTVLCAGLTACPAPGQGGPDDAGPGVDGGNIIDDGFADHTKRTLATDADFEAYAAASASASAVKYVITHFQKPGENMRWLES